MPRAEASERWSHRTRDKVNYTTDLHFLGSAVWRNSLYKVFKKVSFFLCLTHTHTFYRLKVCNSTSLAYSQECVFNVTVHFEAFFILLKRNPPAHTIFCTPPTPFSEFSFTKQTLIYFPFLCIFPLWAFHTNGILQCLGQRHAVPGRGQVSNLQFHVLPP